MSGCYMKGVVPGSRLHCCGNCGTGSRQLQDTVKLVQDGTLYVYHAGWRCLPKPSECSAWWSAVLWDPQAFYGDA